MLSICILTKNSQEDLSLLLPSLNFASEIIIVDDNSSDNTKNIAMAHKCNFFLRKLNSNFASQRNFALRKAKFPWVLFLDPDERVSKELSREILNAVKNDKNEGYFLKREDEFMGKKLKFGETSSIWLLRLAKKNSGIWERPVHEQWQVKNPGRLSSPLIHYPHTSISAFIAKINYYTQIEAEYRKKLNQIPSFWQIIVYPMGKFIRNYFFKLGILDGFEGFIMALMMSIHSFLVRVKTYTI